MNLWFRFRGGPLGGEEREMPASTFSGGRIRVPCYTPVHLYADPNPSMPSSIYTTEEYRVYGSLADRPGYVMQWIHPAERLIRENEELRAQLDELLALEELMEAFKRFAKETS